MRALIFLCLLALSSLAHAQDAQEAQDEAPAGPPLPELTAPYDPYLLRLAEVLGSVHYLRTLCQTGEGNVWRDAMTDLIALENPLPPAVRSWSPASTVDTGRWMRCIAPARPPPAWRETAIPMKGAH